MLPPGMLALWLNSECASDRVWGPNAWARRPGTYADKNFGASN